MSKRPENSKYIAEQMSIADALAIQLTLRRLGYPSTMDVNMMRAAKEVIETHAKEAISRIRGNICTTCWGDGWHRISPGMLGGACHACSGTGKASHP